MNLEQEINRAIDLIYGRRMDGRHPDNQNKESSLRLHFEKASRGCMERYDGICVYCPECACVERAANLANVVLQPLLRYRQGAFRNSGQIRAQLSGKPPPTPPGKQPAMAMSRPQPFERTNAMAKVAKSGG